MIKLLQLKCTVFLKIHRYIAMKFAATACLIFTASLAFADNADWKAVKQKGNVTVMQRAVEGSPYKATNGTIRTSASLFSILAVLRDSAACTEWLYKCKFGETVKEYNSSERVYYTVIDAPLTLSDRDMFIHSVVTYDPDRRRVDIALSGVADYKPPRKGKVRVLDLTGFWVLQEREDGEVDMTYQIHSNPQVSPKGSADRTMIKSVYDTLRRVSKLAQSANYAATQFSEDEIRAISH